MILEAWIWAALGSMLLYVVKVMSIRVYCRDLDGLENVSGPIITIIKIFIEGIAP